MTAVIKSACFDINGRCLGPDLISHGIIIRASSETENTSIRIELLVYYVIVLPLRWECGLGIDELLREVNGFDVHALHNKQILCALTN